MRDRIAHGYRDIDLPLVWTISTEELPPVTAQLEGLVSLTMAASEGWEGG